jgi:LPXTG-motif cell wall-anchored protein
MKNLFRVGALLAIVLALLPSIAGAKPPDPKGKLVYEDDFSSAAKSKLEDNLTATDYQRGFHPPGVYHLKLFKNDDVRWSLFPNQSYAEFSVLVDVFDFSDDINAGAVSQGLVFRAKDDSHFYAVLIDPRRGQYAVRKQDGANKWSDLIAFKASSLVKRQKEVNQLRVDGEGDSFTIYLNDEQLDTFKDASYAQGKIGFIAANMDAKEPHMHFDNIKVYTTDTQSASGPSALPTTGQEQGAPALLLVAFALLLLSLGMRMRRRVH